MSSKVIPPIFPQFGYWPVGLLLSAARRKKNDLLWAGRLASCKTSLKQKYY